MWTKYFKVVGIVPGEVHVPSLGIIDFSKPGIPVEICQGLWESGFPYLEITEAGKHELYSANPQPPQEEIHPRAKLKKTGEKPGIISKQTNKHYLRTPFK